MSTLYGPQAVPVPQPTEPPDGPGAFLALIQKLQVGGIQQYDLFSNMTAALGNGYNGQIVNVYADAASSNGYWISNGSGWTLWQRGWTDFTPTVSGLTLGGGSQLYAKYKVTNGECRARIGWRLGSSSPAVGDVTVTYPIPIATWLNDLAMLGLATFYHAASTTSGRFRGAVYKTGTALRIVCEGTSANMAPLSPTAPFAWAASDEIHIEVTYPV